MGLGWGWDEMALGWGWDEVGMGLGWGWDGIGLEMGWDEVGLRCCCGTDVQRKWEVEEERHRGLGQAARGKVCSGIISKKGKKKCD